MEYFVVYDERTSLTKTDTTKEVETTEKNVAFQHIHSICNMSLSLYIYVTFIVLLRTRRARLQRAYPTILWISLIQLLNRKWLDRRRGCTKPFFAFQPAHRVLRFPGQPVADLESYMTCLTNKIKNIDKMGETLAKHASGESKTLYSQLNI